MATSFDITGRINAVVASGSLTMLKKLQMELRQTAKALVQMGETSTASALGHTAMALDRVAGATKKAVVETSKMAKSASTTAGKIKKLKNESAEQASIAKRVSEGWKLNIVESQALSKAVGLLGKKYTYAVNAQKEWVPALESAMTGINKQKAAMVASGRAISTHVSSTELFDRVNRKLALGADKVKSSFTAYGKAMESSLGRSAAFRGETTKLAKSFGVQGEAFNKQFAALTKVDNVWREHVTTMHRAGKITTAQARGMYDSYKHLGVGAKELQTRIKASNGELVNAATYNKAAREELDRHTKSMAVLNTKEKKLAELSGKSVGAIQKETEAMMKRTGSLDAVVAGIDKQTKAYGSMGKAQAEVVKKERTLAKATGARVGKIQEITTRMRAQGVSYANISKHLDTLKTRHSAATTQMGRVSKASDALRKSNRGLAKEIDALGKIRLKNLAATQASAKSLEGLARKYPQLSKQVAFLSQKVAAGNMPLSTADKLLNQMRAGMGKTTAKASMLSRAMSSLVTHLKSFAAYAVALMGEKIREIGRTTKFSASEVAVAMRTLGQAGFTASEAIASIGAVSDLATGTLTSMNTVVDLVTTAIRAFDLEATETTRVSDIFANAVNRSKLTIDKLRIAFNYIGPIAAKTGITLEETASTTMMLANAGIRASTIGTGLRRTFQQLIEPTKELQAAIEAAGYTTEDFNPQMNDMRDIIRRLAEIVPDAESAFRMFSLRSSAAVAALSSQGVASFDALHSAVLRSGTAAEMAETQIEGLGIIFKQAMDKAQDLALAFGEAGVTGALRVVGKGLQLFFDALRIFISSGIGKAIIAVASLVASLYGLMKVWALIKMSTWASAVMSFATSMWGAVAAGKTLSSVMLLLQSSLGIALVGLTALYGLYKLYTVFLKTEVSKANTDYIDELDEIHKKELERLEAIKRLVGVARDELAYNRERSNALAELSKHGVDLNLVIEEETGLVKNLTDSVLDNKEALDGAAKAFGNYSEKAKIEDLEAQVQLFEETGEAVKGVVPKLVHLEKYAGSFSGRMVGWVSSILNKIPLIGSSFESTAEKMDIYRKGIDALESQQGEAYERMVNSVTSFGEITQEVWENYMLQAGASEAEVAELFTDSSEKISRAHVEAYLKIQLAGEELTKEERERLERHSKLVGDLFDKLNNTTTRLLEKDLRAVRESYKERADVVNESYDEEINRLRAQSGYVAGTYEEINRVVAEKSSIKLALLRSLYEEEKALIEGAKLGMVEEQERISELDKKYANRKLKMEQELAGAIQTLAEEQLEILTESYGRASTAYDESVDRRIGAVNKLYDWEVAKAKQQLDWELANNAERTRSIEDLGKRIVDLEAQRFDELARITKESFEERLAKEKLYHDESLVVVASAQAAIKVIYEEGDEELIKAQEGLSDKLIEIERASMEKRLSIMEGWADDLSDKYEAAVDATREYSSKIVDLEKAIQEIRKKTLDQLAGIAETTESLMLKIAQAGMGEAELAASEYVAAVNKKKRADELMASGTAENVKKAIGLYKEYQKAIAELAVSNEKALKSETEEYQKAEKLRLEANRLWSIGSQKEYQKVATKYWELMAKIRDEKVEAPITTEAARMEIQAIDDVLKGAVETSGQMAVDVKQDQVDIYTTLKQQSESFALEFKNSLSAVNSGIEELTGSLQQTGAGLTEYVDGLSGLESKEYRIDLTTVVDGTTPEEAFGSIKEKVDSIAETKPKVEVSVIGASLVENLIGLIAKVVDKVVTIEAKVVGLDLVRALKDAIDAVKDKTVTITTRHVEARQGGGSIGEHFTQGGPVPGSGIGDKVEAWLEPKEYVIRKESAIKYGNEFLSQVNSGTYQPPVSKESEQTEKSYNFNINIGGASLKGTAVKSVLERFQLDLRKQELVRGMA
jgi:TP901 family phage tail tape measure protein